MPASPESVRTDRSSPARVPSATKRFFVGEGLCALVLAGAFALFAWLSWRTWPDILVDFGHELYIPWRLSAGEMLYRDIVFTMGPLSQSVNAFLFGAFGASLSTLIAANLTLLAAIAGMLYWLFRRLGTAWTTTYVVLFFLAVFAFAQDRVIGNYNYVCPYRHEVTHGLALGLAELICLTRFSETGRARWLAGAGSLVGMVAMTKLEMLFPAAVAAVSGVAIVARSESGRPAEVALEKSRGRSLVWLAILGTGVVIPLVIGTAVLALDLEWQAAVKALAANWRLALDPALTSQSGFYRALAGWDQPLANAAQMLLSAAVVVGVAAAALLIEYVPGAWARSRVGPVVVGTAAVPAALFVVPVGEWSAAAAAVPLLLAVVVPAAAARVLKEGAARSTLPLFLVAVYGLCLLPKIALAAGWGHYGFVLAMPGTLVLVHLAVHSVPAWLRRQHGSGAYFRAIALGVLTVCAAAQVAIWTSFARAKTTEVGEGADRFYAGRPFDDRVKPVRQTLAFLKQAMGPHETLAVIPEGGMLNYLLRKRNPTGFLIFNPWEFDAHGGEERVLAVLARSPPDYIVVVTMDMTVHGRGNFGSPDYGGPTLEWIEENYSAVDSQVSLDALGRPTFQSLVYRRRADGDR